MTRSNLQRVQIVVRGRVQGVFFRASAATQARKLGIQGFVRNRPDGAVEIVAEGDHQALQSLLQWAQVGPPSARVDEVEAKWDKAEGGFNGFTIR
jgi:acylphosphatase